MHQTKSILRAHRLHSVCEEARCPNKSDCFKKTTAAFMILGRSCSRDCGFCAVSHGEMKSPDQEEPERLAEAVKEMGLRHVVITSVTRDDLQDGGASHFASVIRAVRRLSSGTSIEVLTPDFMGSLSALISVLEACPDVFNHNLETINRLYPTVRPQADYHRSLYILREAKQIAPSVVTKSGFMLGLGETMEETLELMQDIRDTGCDTITIGQYLQPSRKNLPVVSYVHPAIFEELRQKALQMGFAFAASAPLVRSSMNAEEAFEKTLSYKVS